MKKKAAKRNKRRSSRGSKCRPQVEDLVLAKCQAASDVAEGVTKKFARPCDGQWKVTRFINRTTYEFANEQCSIKKVYNQTAREPYLTSVGNKSQIDSKFEQLSGLRML
jgi:hypothetical protein